MAHKRYISISPLSGRNHIPNDMTVEDLVTMVACETRLTKEESENALVAAINTMYDFDTGQDVPHDEQPCEYCDVREYESGPPIVESNEKRIYLARKYGKYHSGKREWCIEIEFKFNGPRWSLTSFGEETHCVGTSVPVAHCPMCGRKL